MLSRSLLVVCFVLGLLTPAHAQRARFPEGMKPQMEPFAAEGTIEAVTRGRIQILTTTEQKWMIFVDPKAVIHITGTAEADFVRPGMFIQFTAEFDKRGKAKEKVKKLTVFTPSREVGIGFWPEGMAPMVGAEGEAAAAGGGFGGGFGGGGFGGGAAGGVAGGVAGGAAATSSVYTVHGQIRGNRKGRLTVNAGRAMFQIELAEEPEIQVDLADYSVAKQGDKISITRGQMFAGRMGIAQASQFSIQLSEPLTLAKKRPKTIVPKPPGNRKRWNPRNNRSPNPWRRKRKQIRRCE